MSESRIVHPTVGVSGALPFRLAVETLGPEEDPRDETVLSPLLEEDPGVDTMVYRPPKFPNPNSAELFMSIMGRNPPTLFTSGGSGPWSLCPEHSCP